MSKACQVSEHLPIGLELNEEIGYSLCKVMFAYCIMNLHVRISRFDLHGKKSKLGTMYVLRSKAMMPYKKITFFYIVILKINLTLSAESSLLFTKQYHLLVCMQFVCRCGIWVHETSHSHQISFIYHWIHWVFDFVAWNSPCVYKTSSGVFYKLCMKQYRFHAALHSQYLLVLCSSLFADPIICSQDPSVTTSKLFAWCNIHF